MTTPDRLTAIRARLADPSFGPVASGEVAWLCDEVERLRGRRHRCGCMWCCSKVPADRPRGEYHRRCRTTEGDDHA